MREATRSYGGLVTAPHHLAAQAGVQILREGGYAIEAMIAAAATIAVAYPHMNGLGGDGFWLIGRRGGPVMGIQACGGAARQAPRAWYRAPACEAIPKRGPLYPPTVAGTDSGWDWGHRLSCAPLGGQPVLLRRRAQAATHRQ